MRKILKLPNKKLREISREVKFIDERIKRIIAELNDSLENEEIGVGLAAPQLGYSERIIVVGTKEIKDSEGKVIQKEIPTSIYINPKISKYSKEKVEMDEGCLSYPGYYGLVLRSKKIRFTALTPDGTEIKKDASDYFARIIQHEVDHLDGILFIDRVKDPSKIKKIKRKKENVKKE